MCSSLRLPATPRAIPFHEVPAFGACFSYKHRTVEVDGFYDGDGVYRVRFMPDVQGEWRYRTVSNLAALDGVEGSFTLHRAATGQSRPGARRRHLSLRLRRRHALQADRHDLLRVESARARRLRRRRWRRWHAAPFNKIRFCVFPKHYRYNENEPELYPFPCLARGGSQWAGSNAVDLKAGWRFDFDHLCPAYFQHLEACVASLCDLGIEADIILFHPYDRWGFATMDAEHDARYLRYVVARLAAYRNVWWSMANEYDLMRNKSMADWDRFFRIVQECDPYQHLRSIHNWRDFYDHSKPWVTHQSIQRPDLAQVSLWRSQVKKPVVVDECCYEGDIPMGWGNISAREMVHRFWLGTAHGGYVGHGETYLHPDAILWWAKGRRAARRERAAPGLSPPVAGTGPAAGLDPISGMVNALPCAGKHTTST
jgi:hypothetical protein